MKEGKKPLEPKEKLSKAEKTLLHSEKARKDTKEVFIGRMGGQTGESQTDDSSSNDDYHLNAITNYHVSPDKRLFRVEESTSPAASDTVVASEEIVAAATTLEGMHIQSVVSSDTSFISAADVSLLTSQVEIMMVEPTEVIEEKEEN